MAEAAEAAEASESTVTVTLSSSPPSSDSEADAEITSSSETGPHTQSPEPSLLSRLRAPQLAEIGRKRSVHRNYPPKGKRPSKGRGHFNPKTVTPAQRVKEFHDECLCVSVGKLFCQACREELSTKRSVLKCHISSKKHQDRKKKREQKEVQEIDIAQALKTHDTESHPKGESLPIQHRVYRVKVMNAFLRAGIPLQKLDYFRDILEESAYSLTDRRHMSDLIPFILAEEQAKVKKEVENEDVSIIFDGTTRLGEAMAVVARFVNSDWVVVQRLLRMQMLAKSMTGEEIARELISVLSTTYSIASDHLLAAMRDRASVNGVAMRTVKIVYPKVLDIGRFSHTIDHVGDKFKTPILNEFVSNLVKHFSHSPKARLLRKDQTGKSMPSYSATRWWSKWEVMKELMVKFGEIEPYLALASKEDIGTATTTKMFAVLSAPQKKGLLQLELAATIDIGEAFVKATYHLEGDGPLALECYEVISMLQASISNNHHPNVDAIANQLSGDNANARQQLVSYALSCTQPGLDYFTAQLSASLCGPLKAFKSARLVNPKKVAEMMPTATDVDSLSSLPFVTSMMLGDLKSELPSYIAKVANISDEYCPLKWWKNNCGSLPHWSSLARKILLVQPSSGAAERVFSLLANSFGDRQNNALQDYVELSMMVQYNGR